MRCQASLFGGCLRSKPEHPKPQTALHEEMEISKYQAELADQMQIQANWNLLAQTMMNITGKKKPVRHPRQK